MRIRRSFFATPHRYVRAIDTTSMKEPRLINSWNDLTNAVESYREGGWIFRGEASDEFGELKPKVARVSKTSNSPRRAPYTLKDERRAFNEFCKLSRPYLPMQPRSEIEWLSIAQHHGLPTRLLDWTTNLFVAAFFAVERAGKARGVIYCVRDLEEVGDDDSSWSVFTDSNSVKIYRPPAISPRVFAQQSVFTCHSEPQTEFKHSSLERWLVASSACWSIKRSLNAAGLNAASLFPGLDGLSRHLAWLYKWSFFEGSKERKPATPAG